MKPIKMSDHLQAGSALAEFLAGRLGAPECWPADCKVTPTVIAAARRKQQTAAKNRVLAAARKERNLRKATSSTGSNKQN
jgi:hypothetical protein